MSAPGTIAILVPVEEEFAPYRGLIPGLRRVGETGPWEVHEGRAGEHRVVIVVSDCGPANAGAATERVISQFEPCVVLHGGAAGAHAGDLLPGDVVVGSRYCILFPPSAQRRVIVDGRQVFRKGFRFRRNGERVHFPECRTTPALLRVGVRTARRELPLLGEWTGPGWPPGVAPRAGRVTPGLIGSVDTWTSDPAGIDELHELYGARCEDMESAYVAQVCALHGIPFLAIRAISNNEAVCGLEEADVPRAIGAAGLRVATVIASVARGL